MNRLATFFVVFSIGINAYGVQLLPNSDFELLQLDEFDQPILDSVGNEVPVSWFRDQNVTDGIPHTALISPNNMNNAAQDNTGDDSTGTGTNSIALNAATMDFGQITLGLPTDWRSQGVATTPDETLILAFDFKFKDVEDISPNFDDEGFMAQIRSFTGIEESGSTSGVFKGEISPVILAQDYENDVWHSISFAYTVPSEGAYTDVRITANTFGTVTLSSGQVLLDKVSIHRMTADFDQDLVVDGLDLAIWAENYGLDTGATNATGDADGNGIVDGRDFLTWQREFGYDFSGSLLTPAIASVAQVPEPSTAILGLGTALVLLSRRRSLTLTTPG